MGLIILHWFDLPLFEITIHENAVTSLLRIFEPCKLLRANVLKTIVVFDRVGEEELPLMNS